MTSRLSILSTLLVGATTGSVWSQQSPCSKACSESAPPAVSAASNALPVAAFLAPAQSERGYLGVRIDLSDGVRVVEVMQGGGAAEAGLAPGDRLVSVDGQSAASAEDVQSVLAGLEAGSKVTVVFERDGQQSKAKVRLRSMSEIEGFSEEEEVEAEEGEGEELVEVGEEPQIEWLDLDESGLHYASEERGFLGITLDSGEGPMIVSTVRPGGGAAEAGVSAGDVILEIDGEDGDTERLLEVLSSKHAGERVRIVLRRGEGEKEAQIELRTQAAIGSELVPIEIAGVQPDAYTITQENGEDVQDFVLHESDPGLHVFRAHLGDAKGGEQHGIQVKVLGSLAEQLHDLDLPADVIEQVHQALQKRAEQGGSGSGSGFRTITLRADGGVEGRAGTLIERTPFRDFGFDTEGQSRIVWVHDDEQGEDADEDEDEDGDEDEDEDGDEDEDDDGDEADDEDEDDDAEDEDSGARAFFGGRVAPRTIVWRSHIGDGEELEREIVVAPRTAPSLRQRAPQRAPGAWRFLADGAQADHDRRVQELEHEIHALEQRIQELEQGLRARRAR